MDTFEIQVRDEDNVEFAKWTTTSSFSNARCELNDFLQQACSAMVDETYTGRVFRSGIERAVLKVTARNNTTVCRWASLAN